MDIPVWRWIIKKLKKSIAIVEEGTTASQAIASGKYVMWKGVLCKASSAISQGATLSTASGGNLTAINEGVANEVKDLADQIVPQAVSTGITGVDAYKIGRLVQLYGHFSSRISVSAGSLQLVGVLPNSLRPIRSYMVGTAVSIDTERKMCDVIVDENGNLYLESSVEINVGYFTLTYISVS